MYIDNILTASTCAVVYIIRIRLAGFNDGVYYNGLYVLLHMCTVNIAF